MSTQNDFAECDMSSVSDSYVRVHIWLHPTIAKDQRSKVRLQKYSPGHVALEVHSKGSVDEVSYISFWPPTQWCCSESRSHFHKDYETDKRAEGNRDSEQIDLPLSLENIKKIQAAYEKFKASPYEWKEWGSSDFRNPYENNCVGLVLDLLAQGGIDSKNAPHYGKIALAVSLSAIILFPTLIIIYKRVLLDAPAYLLKEIQNRMLKTCLEIETQFVESLHFAYINERKFHTTVSKATAVSQEIVALLDKGIKDNLENLKTLHETVVLINTSVLSTIKFATDLTKNATFHAIGALCTPLIFNTTVFAVHQTLWTTKTPADVKRIVTKKKQLLDKATSNNSWSYFSRALGLGLFASFCFLGKKIFKG